jgi:hypothetical protein
MSKKVFPFLLMLVIAAPMLAQQTLGDVARQNRAKKKAAATVKLDDDNMPRTQVVDNTAPADASKAAPAADTDKAKKEAADAAKQKTDDAKSKVEAQKQVIAGMQRELDLLQREQRLRAAAYYADAGTRLRDSGKFEQDAKKEQDDIDAKKAALDAAQAKLADLQEDARKAGVPDKQEIPEQPPK